VVVGEEFVDGHVDDFVLGVVHELDEPTGDSRSIYDCPDAELFGVGVDGVEAVEQFAQLREGVLPL